MCTTQRLRNLVLFHFQAFFSKTFFDTFCNQVVVVVVCEFYL